MKESRTDARPKSLEVSSVPDETPEDSGKENYNYIVIIFLLLKLPHGFWQTEFVYLTCISNFALSKFYVKVSLFNTGFTA